MKRHKDCGVKCIAIAVSKPLTNQIETTVVQQRKGPLAEVPICAHVRGDEYLVCYRNKSDMRTCRFLPRCLRAMRIANKALYKQSRSSSAARAAGISRLNLPGNLSDYDRKPWCSLRDAVAVAHWRAEVVRANEGGAAFDVNLALAAFEPQPSQWRACDKTVFIAWTSQKLGGVVEYHLSRSSIQTLFRSISKTQERS